MAKSISQSRDGLSRLFAKDRLSARQLNALMDLAPSRLPAEPGCLTDQFGTARRPQLKSRDAWMRVKCDDDVPPFGIVEVYNGSWVDGDYYLQVRKVTDTGRVFAASEDYHLYPGGDGWARLVTAFAPVQVRAVASMSFLQYADVTTGDDRITESRGGPFIVVSTTETLSGTFKTGIVLHTGAPGLLGKTGGPVVQGQMADVHLYAPIAGRAVSSWSDLADTGETVPALFPFGSAPALTAWVGLIDVSYVWAAYVIECVGP